MGNKLTLYTTLAHEGYPGHLYQTVYYASTKPDPLRSIFNFGGYVEGWATYAEMVPTIWQILLQTKGKNFSTWWNMGTES